MAGGAWCWWLVGSGDDGWWGLVMMASGAGAGGWWGLVMVAGAGG